MSRNYTNPIEIINIIVSINNSIINYKKTYKAFSTDEDVETFRVDLTNRFNSMFKVKCEINFHLRKLD